jgi:hypothetical protein
MLILTPSEGYHYPCERESTERHQEFLGSPDLLKFLDYSRLLSEPWSVAANENERNEELT